MLPDFSYATYVWSSYAVAAAVIVWQALQPIFRHRRLEKQIKQDHAARSTKQS